MSIPLKQANGGQKVAAVLLGTIGSGLLFSASLTVPLIGFASAFIAPAPLGLTRLRAGRTAAVFATLLTMLLLAVLLSPPIGAWYLVQCGLIGLLVPELALRGMRPFRSILWSTAAAVTLAAVLITVLSISSAVDPQLFVQKEINSGITQAAKLYEQQAGLSSQELDMLKQGMQTVGELMLRLYPSLATINLGLISTITLLLFSRLALRQSVAVSQIPFKAFRTPELLIWPLIVAGFAMLAPTPLVTTPAQNILLLLAVLYFMQGLAVLLTFCERSTFAGTFKVLLAVALLTQPYLAGVVVIIGIFDLWGDFRTPRIKQDENL